MISRLAAAYLFSLSVTSTRGARPCFLRSLRNRRLGAFLSRRLWTRTSRTKPSWSTARQSQCFFPAKLTTTSSRCHLSPRRGARRRIRLANSRPNLRPHCRIVSCVTEIPRAASISSTMRRLNGDRKYSHTAQLMISAGERVPAYIGSRGVLIPPVYTSNPAPTKPALDQLDGAVLTSSGPSWHCRHYISLTAVLEFGPTETLPTVGVISKQPGVSADAVAKPSAQTRAESRVLDLRKRLRKRDGLSAGGRWIRTIGPP